MVQSGNWLVQHRSDRRDERGEREEEKRGKRREGVDGGQVMSPSSCHDHEHDHDDGHHHGLPTF